MISNLKFKTSQHRIFFSLLFIGILIVVAVLTVQHTGISSKIENKIGSVLGLISRETYTIELRKDGFYPTSITIQEGDTIKFITNTDKGFWPASDPHPTHEYLSGFDPGHPVSPDASWEHTFTELGTWRFHDHLSVSFQGEITVLGKNILKRFGENECDNSKGNEGKCFDNIIRNTVNEEGIAAAYRLFQDVYASGELPRSCHWTAHQIGEEAYELFKRGDMFSITNETTYCGYGFFHGFLESLLREDPDIEYALSFCEEAERQLGTMGLQNCYHGIGHGFTEDPPDPLVWGDFDAMVKPGVEICEYLFGNSFQNLNLCLTGVFTVPAGFADKGEFGLSLDPKDPFSTCRTQPYRYKKACYGEFAAKLDTILNWDLSKLPSYLEDISDEKVRRLVTWVVPSVMISRDILASDYSSYILGCQGSFNGSLKNICLGGTILGFFTHGEPGKQYEPAIRFCSSELLTDTETDLCYEELFHFLYREYTKEKIETICSTVIPLKYRNQCLKEEHGSVYDDPSFE